MVIFDEAHNLESVASDASSFELTSAQVAGAQEEALRCHKLCSEGGLGLDQVRKRRRVGGPAIFAISAMIYLSAPAVVLP